MQDVHTGMIEEYRRAERARAGLWPLAPSETGDVRLGLVSAFTWEGSGTFKGQIEYA